MKSFQLEIVTPDKLLDKGEVTYVRCPGMDGLFGVMNGHIPALIGMKTGEIKVTKDGNDLFFATSGGYADISAEKVELLVETAEQADEIDVTRAVSARDKAKEHLSKGDVDYIQAKAKLDRAANRLAIANRH